MSTSPARTVSQLLAWAALACCLVIAALASYFFVVAEGEVDERGAGGAVAELLFGVMTVLALGGVVASALVLWLLHRNRRG